MRQLQLIAHGEPLEVIELNTVSEPVLGACFGEGNGGGRGLLINFDVKQLKSGIKRSLLSSQSRE